MKKFVNFVKKYKLPIAIVLVGSIFIILLLRKGVGPAPTPTPVPLPFRLEQIFPSPGRQEIVIPNFAIHFTFSKPIDLVNTVVKIEPFSDFEISADNTGKTLFLTPVPEWEFGTKYKITVSTKSEDGQTLDSPVEYLFQPVMATSSDLDETPW